MRKFCICDVEPNAICPAHPPKKSAKKLKRTPIRKAKQDKPEMAREYLRVVFQLEDTPNNRQIIMAAMAALQQLPGIPEGRCPVIKQECIFIAAMMRPRKT